MESQTNIEALPEEAKALLRKIKAYQDANLAKEHQLQQASARKRNMGEANERSFGQRMDADLDAMDKAMKEFSEMFPDIDVDKAVASLTEEAPNEDKRT